MKKNEKKEKKLPEGMKATDLNTYKDITSKTGVVDLEKRYDFCFLAGAVKGMDNAMNVQVIGRPTDISYAIANAMSQDKNIEYILKTAVAGFEMLKENFVNGNTKMSPEEFNKRKKDKTKK